MIVKKISVSKTGDKSVHYTSDKEGFKIVIKKGVPHEVEMDKEERSNRDHGKDTNSHGAKGSGNKQRGISRINKEAETDYKNKMEESTGDINKKAKKVQDLALKLKKAKLDYNTSMLDKRMADFEKNEGLYKKALERIGLDKKKLKERNSFYVDYEETPEKLSSDDVSERLDAVLSQTKDEKKEKVVTEDVSVLERLESVSDISDLYGTKESKNKGDILSRLDRKLEEAEEDAPEEDAPEETPEEDAPEEDTSEETPEEDATAEKDDIADEIDNDEDGEDNENTIPMQANQIAIVTASNEYNVEQNNVYDYYDFICDRLSDPTAIEALNTEYKQVDKARRKVTPAKEFYNRVVKRVSIMNKREADEITQALNGSASAEEDDLEL